MAKLDGLVIAILGRTNTIGRQEVCVRDCSNAGEAGDRSPAAGITVIQNSASHNSHQQSLASIYRVVTQNKGSSLNSPILLRFKRQAMFFQRIAPLGATPLFLQARRQTQGHNSSTRGSLETEHRATGNTFLILIRSLTNGLG